MPYFFETKKIRLPRTLDRRVKLTDEDKNDIIRLHKKGTPIREIARLFKKKCSRRQIQFILFPQRLVEVRKHSKERADNHAKAT